MSQCENRFAPVRVRAKAAIDSPDPNDNDESIRELTHWIENPQHAWCAEQIREAQLLIVALHLRKAQAIMLELSARQPLVPPASSVAAKKTSKRKKQTRKKQTRKKTP